MYPILMPITPNPEMYGLHIDGVEARKKGNQAKGLNDENPEDGVAKMEPQKNGKKSSA